MASYCIDDEWNADWIRDSWNIPPYKSEEFMDFLEWLGITLEKFKSLEIYARAREYGWISPDDEWVRE
jgi:hypothetical protein